MNKIRISGIAFTSMVLFLAVGMVLLNMNPGAGKQEVRKSENKPAFREKEAAILPIIVIGGLQFFRKSFEKK